jgi:hypothetical protein
MTERAEFTSQREQLKAAVTAPEIVSLSNGRKTPLTIDRLRIQVPGLYQRLAGENGFPGSADFFDCDEALGWPDDSDEVMSSDDASAMIQSRHAKSRAEELGTATDDSESPINELRGFVHGMREYKSVDDFAYHLTHGSNAMDYPNKGLNNFLVPFTMHEEFEFGDSFKDHDPMHLAMITEPHFMRLKAIAPEFVAALRQSVQYHLSEKTPVSTDPLLVEGLMRAYNIMGRLVKTDDIARHAHFLGYEGEQVEKIEDVHHALVS